MWRSGIAESDASGNIYIGRINYNGVADSGYMTLQGYGHGVQIAVEPNPSGGYPAIWVEKNVQSSGFGNQVGRVRYNPGKIYQSSFAQDVTPQLGRSLSGLSPAIDPRYNNVCYRFRNSSDGQLRAVTYSVADAIAGRLSSSYRLSEYAIPEPPTEGGVQLSPQGHAFYGHYIYLLSGNSGSAYNSKPSDIQIANLNAPAGLKDKFTTNAGGTTIYNREPEGMSILQLGGGDHLSFGFKNRASDGTQKYGLSIFYKSDLITGFPA